jgi:DNA-directed RNA polymerase specialized sigma24 family protein
VIRRYYFEQQPWGEIADGMGSTPRTVQRLRQQAVEELANLYAFADGILRR